MSPTSARGGLCEALSPGDAAHASLASEAADGRLRHCKHTLQVRHVVRVGRLCVELTALDVVTQDLQHTQALA